MIDIEDDVFNRVAQKLRDNFENISVYGEEVGVPSSFPCVTIIEADNSADVNTQDSSNMENHANLMYEVNGYSNLVTGKKKQCKEMLAVIDAEFASMGFTRTTKLPTPMQDATVYRMTARYTAKASKNNVIYRR